MEGIAAGLVEDLILKAHGVMNGLAGPKENAKPSHGLAEGSCKRTGHSKALGMVGN